MKRIGRSNNYLKVGENSQLLAKRMTLGKNILIGRNVFVGGDSITIGDNTVINDGCDIRSSLIEIGKDSEIGNNCKILVADVFKIGEASRLSNYASIVCRSFTARKFLYLANNFCVGYGGNTESTSRVSLGNRVALGPHNILNANVDIKLSDMVGSGSY